MTVRVQSLMEWNSERVPNDWYLVRLTPTTPRKLSEEICTTAEVTQAALCLSLSSNTKDSAAWRRSSVPSNEASKS
jgi:hypothetical protein